MDIESDNDERISSSELIRTGFYWGIGFFLSAIPFIIILILTYVIVLLTYFSIMDPWKGM